MKKYTFEELVEPFSNNEDSEWFETMQTEDVIKLLKQVRQATLEECAKKTTINLIEYAKFGGKIINIENFGEEVPTEDSQKYYQVNKDFILDLDKDSIEVDE